MRRTRDNARARGLVQQAVQEAKRSQDAAQKPRLLDSMRGPGGGSLSRPQHTLLLASSHARPRAQYRRGPRPDAPSARDTRSGSDRIESPTDASPPGTPGKPMPALPPTPERTAAPVLYRNFMPSPVNAPSLGKRNASPSPSPDTDPSPFKPSMGIFLAISPANHDESEDPIVSSPSKPPEPPSGKQGPKARAGILPLSPSPSPLEPAAPRPVTSPRQSTMTGLFRRPSKQPRLAGMLGFGEARAVPEQAKEIGGAGGSEERQRRGQEEGASTATLSPSPLPPRPKHAGLVNLGNTCYLNAVLQALLSVPAFATDLRSSALDALAIPDGVVTALSALDRQRQRAAAAAGAPGVAVQGPLSPLPVKESVASRLDRFHGTLQHDAHEFLVSLMDIAQQEVLSAEARRWRRKGVPVTATACPVSRTFSMCLEHAFSCPRCGARSHVSETTTVLSVDVPPPSAEPHDAQALLSRHFATETVEKRCDRCGTTQAHTVSHRVSRMPRAMLLHLKRFRVEQGLDGMPELRKCFARVRAPATLSLAAATSGSAGRHTWGPIGERDADRIAREVSDLLMDKEDKENLHRSATPTPYASGANIPREASVLKPKNLWGNASPRSRPDSPTCAAENAAPGGTRGERERETAKEAVDGGTWRGAAGRVFLQEDETANSGRAYPTGTGRGQGAAPPESVRYSLRAVVRHVGATLSAGHFVADARCDGREWVRFDDARVEALGASEAEMPSSTSYVLVYVHDSVDG